MDGRCGQESRLGSAVRGQGCPSMQWSRPARSPTASGARAEEQLAACEASDWFWWFGDYNPSEAVRDFDELFRPQLTSLYRALKLGTTCRAGRAHQRRSRCAGVRRRDASLMKREAVLSRRRAGVLLPAASLCQPDGGSAFGASGRRFVDWLAEAGFTVWQLLPLVPVDSSGSPYWARADRAGNPALLDPAAPDPAARVISRNGAKKPHPGSTIPVVRSAG